MPFEQILRDHLLDDAEVVTLPERGDPAVPIARARARRRHQVTAAALATVVAVAAAGVAALPALRDDGGAETLISPAANGLEPTGPLDLEWSPADGGLSGTSSQFQQADGSVYALSTAPGVRGDDPHPFQPAIYRLDDNGVWQPLDALGERKLQDVVGVDGSLYGVSTGPAAGGEGVVTRLSRSGDDGATWTDQELPPADPPNTSHPWDSWVQMAVESNGPVTLAVVTTSFAPDVTAYFPEMQDPSRAYSVEPREEGLVLREEPAVWASPTPATTGPTTTVEVGEDGAVARGDDGEQPALRTVPWSDLGVASQAEAYPTRSHVYRLSGDTWEPVDNNLGDVGLLELGRAGDLFTATYYAPGTGGEYLDAQMLVSADGVTWSEVTTPRPGFLVGAGPALVNTPTEGTSIDISGDGGVTWAPFDLSDVGMASDCTIYSAAGGDLGVALIISGPDGRPEALATSADMVTWTITSLSDIAGPGDIRSAQAFVGRDRIVVGVTMETGDSTPGPSRTAVGTPRRS